MTRRDQADAVIAGNLHEFFERASAERGVFSAMLPPKPIAPSLIPTADGSISQLLLTIPTYATTNPEYAAAYESLFKAMPAGVKFIVLVHESAANAVNAWITSHNHAPHAVVIEAPDYLHFSVWAEDGYVVSTDDQATFFIEPYAFPRYADSLVSDMVSHGTSLSNTQAPLYFQGGNCLVGDDFWFIGVDYPANSLRYIPSVISPQAGEDNDVFIRRLYREYLDVNRNLIYIGSTTPVPSETYRLVKENGAYKVDNVFAGNHVGTRQPLFHIDMFITLAGRNSAGKYRVLVGDPSAAAQLTGERISDYHMTAVFQNIAEALTKLGFDVIRNPLPLTSASETVETEAFNHPDDAVFYAIYSELKKANIQSVEMRSWYFATANNALVEYLPGGTSTVYLPTYGHDKWAHLKTTDDENKRIWEQLGFQVRQLSNFHPFAQNLGAVHCIKKYLARNP